MKQTSCIFSYEKRVFDHEGNPVLLDDGKTIRTNWNFVSFLQVISAYWETKNDGKLILNIFLNGGSLVEDRNTGNLVSKSGYTIVLPEFLGTRFIEEWGSWSYTFGLASPVTQNVQRSSHNGARSAQRTSNSRSVREEEFVQETPLVPAWETPQV